MLYGFGSNGCGQLGLGHEDDVDLPNLAELPLTAAAHDLPVTVVAGGNHALVQTESGAVFATGNNSDGRYNLSSLSISKFQQIPGLKIRLCAANWAASSFVDQDGRLLVCGSGEKGELGLGDSITQVSHLSQILNFPPRGTSIVGLNASMGHTVAVLSTGEVWGWGNGRKGQLGQPTAIVWSPRRIEGIPFKAIRAVCGRDFTYMAGPQSGGSHAVIGSDKWGIITDAPHALPHWTTISAGWGAIYVLLSSGKLLSWGRNDHGQQPPPNLPALKHIAAGSEHVLAVTDTGRAIAWGWGEHGNCGPTIDGADVKEHWNDIPMPGTISFVCAGCATSWLCTAPDVNDDMNDT